MQMPTRSFFFFSVELLGVQGRSEPGEAWQKKEPFDSYLSHVVDGGGKRAREGKRRTGRKRRLGDEGLTFTYCVCSEMKMRSRANTLERKKVCKESLYREIGVELV
jgi:hypothetical protein